MNRIRYSVTQNTKICPQCGKEFGPGRWTQNWAKKKYCGSACAHAAKAYTPERREAAFWAKVDKSGGPDACWPWMGARVPAGGYGRFKGEKLIAAHRFAYIVSIGPIEPGLDVMHLCDNPPCCNPAHLKAATTLENMQDAKRKLRHAWGERNKNAKMTADLVREIRSKFRFITPHKTNAKELADEYGMARGTVYLAATGRTWAHLK